MITQNPSGEFR